MFKNKKGLKYGYFGYNFLGITEKINFISLWGNRILRILQFYLILE